MLTVTPRPVRIGVQLAPQHADYSAIRRAAARAEELGADLLVNWDHFFPLGKVRDGKHFECWTMLGAWAEATSRVEIGPLVSCNSYRNPDLLADMARTVDHISGGRLVLGIGAGFKEREFLEYGYEFGTPGERVAGLTAALPRIRRRLDQLNPAPVRRIPILIAGGGEKKSLRVVAEHADIWHTFAEGEAHARKARALAEHCQAIGRDPAEIEHSVHVGGDPVAVGTPLRELGVSLFTISTSGPDYDLAPARDWLAWRDEQNAS
ncbi:LLM class oxidoreductase [Flindersiella endophytica]